MDGQVDERTDEGTNGHTDGLTERTNGHVTGRTDGQWKDLAFLLRVRTYENRVRNGRFGLRNGRFGFRKGTKINGYEKQCKSHAKVVKLLITEMH